MLFGCTLYWNLDRDYDPTNRKLINNRIGSMFFLCLNAYFGVLSNTTFKMSRENNIIYKEIKSRMYTTGDYFLAKSIIDIIFLILPILMCIFPVSLTSLDADQLAILLVQNESDNRDVLNFWVCGIVDLPPWFWNRNVRW